MLIWDNVWTNINKGIMRKVDAGDVQLTSDRIHLHTTQLRHYQVHEGNLTSFSYHREIFSTKT